MFQRSLMINNEQGNTMVDGGYVNNTHFATSTNEYFNNPPFKHNTLPVQICPSVWLGNFETLNDGNFLSRQRIQIIVNCSPTHKFLRFFNDTHNSIVVPSNMIILSLDPAFNTSSMNLDEQVQLMEFTKTYNKILQNYMNYFYKYNDNLEYLIHKNVNNAQLTLNSPILTGQLVNHLFNINRFIKLCKNIDSSIQLLVMSEHGDHQLSTALLISILMDNYNTNFDQSFRRIERVYPRIQKFNHNFYDDLIIVENLKKFDHENKAIKQMNPLILTTNYKLKRRSDDDYDDRKRKM